MANCSPFDEAYLQGLKSQYEVQDDSDAASQIQALVDSVNALKANVGVLGERGAGVSTLTQALLGSRFHLDDPHTFFKVVPTPKEKLVGYSHPLYPNITMWDLPGFGVSEKPTDYLKRLGELDKYSCFVVVVGKSLGDTYLQVLKAIKQKGKAYHVVRTKVDLDLHTAKRRLRSKYSPTEQLALARKELRDTLAKNGLEANKVFLVSGLETEKYEFAHFEDSLEGEILNLKRNHDGDLEDLKPVSERKIKELYKICETGSLSEVPGVILSALDEPSQIQLDVAVLGEVGSGKSSLVNSLRGVCCGEPGAAPTGVTETARKAIAYAFPTIPNLYLWDLPGVGVTEEDVGHLDLSRYNFFLLVASERYKHTHSSLARAIIKAGKSLFFVRSKIDVDLETRPGSQPRPKEELQEQVRKICTEALKKDGVDSPRVFLVSSLDREAFDLPQLLEALQNDAPALKAAALEDAIPAVISRLVRRKSKVLLKDVWGKALQSCLYCMEKPEPDIATSLLTTIASFCIDLGLDEASLGRIAKDTSKPPALLQAEVRCPYTKPVAPEHVLKLITKPVTLYNQVWSYVPYWGRGELTKQLEISFPATYGLMKQVVCDLAEDAERMLLRAFAKD